MGSESAWNEMESLNLPSDDQKSAACKSSQLLRENVIGIQKDNSDVNREMNKFEVHCDPPPITPRCRAVEVPPNPAVVSNRVNDMISREQSMHANITELSPLVATNPKLAEELSTVNNQLQVLEIETNKLYDLTVGGMYDKDAVNKENRTIEKLSKQLDASSKTFLKNLGCDRSDLQNVTIDQEHDTVYCDVAMKPKEVWKQIGKFDTLPWHPGIEPTSAVLEGDVRKLTAEGGSPTFTEQLLGQGEDKKTGLHYYTYKMTEGLPVQPISTLSVEPHGKGSRITWKADMNLSGLDDTTAEAVNNGLKGFYAEGLSALLEKLNKH
jgi:hypothetical protein